MFACAHQPKSGAFSHLSLRVRSSSETETETSAGQEQGSAVSIGFPDTSQELQAPALQGSYGGAQETIQM